MLTRHLMRHVVFIAALAAMISGAAAFDETKYPDWSGQWRRPRGVGFQWDQTKPPGLGQQAPLTPEYQAILEASLADQAAGGQGGDNLMTCRTNGMPRMMTVAWPIEFVVLPNVTYVNFEVFMPRRIYTDGRDFPQGRRTRLHGLFHRQMARHRRRRPLRHARSRDPQLQGTAHL